MKICKCCRQPIKLDSKNLYIFDNGHGGIIDGVYQTPGKRSPIWPDGTQLFEGEFNRSIVDRLMKLCEDANIDCINLVDTNIDIPLSTRTSQANEIYRNTDKPCIYISIHENAARNDVRDALESNSKKGYSINHKPIHLMITGCYKEEYGDGSKGWHVERGAPIKPIGGRMLTIKIVRNKTKDVDETIKYIDSHRIF